MGKAALIYVIGLSFIVGYGLLNINSAGTDAVSNYTEYYANTLTRNIAASGANIGCSDLFLQPTFNTPYNNIAFNGGRMNVKFAVSGNKKFVISIGSLQLGPNTYTDTIVAELHNESLAKYAWFTYFEANKGGQITSWSTGDTAFGPVHTNDKFNINGEPVFMKKATAWQSAVPKKNDAVWGGGYEWGIKIPYPTDLNDFVTAAQSSDGRAIVGNDAYLTLNPGGTLNLRIPDTGIDTTFASATAFATNGAFAVIGANLYVEGTLMGDLAIGAVTGGGSGGNVYITGDIRYKTDPRVDPTSTDKLGIYSENDIQVTYDDSNPAAYQNRKVDASLFTLTGVFEVEEAKKFAPRGMLTTYGAMMQYYRGEIGKVVGGGLQHGYNKNFRYDERLEKSPPRFYPSGGRYTLFSWREN